MPIKTKRWNDPIGPDDGHRLLITRYRPRGVSKSDETWTDWQPRFGPSRELLKEFKTESASPIQWPQYRRRYLVEQKRDNGDGIAELAARVKSGETITLLCSSVCTRESRCHRSLLKELIEAALF